MRCEVQRCADMLWARSKMNDCRYGCHCMMQLVFVIVRRVVSTAYDCVTTIALQLANKPNALVYDMIPWFSPLYMANRCVREAVLVYDMISWLSPLYIQV